MKLKLIVIFFIILFYSNIDSLSQIRIKMIEDRGVYKIPCTVNGLRLRFIFDTGASHVSISLSEANLMLENGYLAKEDIIGEGKSVIADGSLVNNTRIILREIIIGDLKLHNVEAIVINELKAPLLLGQSAIQKLGKIMIEGDEMVIINAKGLQNRYTDTEIDEMFLEAVDFYKRKLYRAAAEKYQKLYDNNLLTEYGIYTYAMCYYFSENYQEALNILHKINEKSEINKFYLFNSMGNCYYYLKEYSNSELFHEKSLPFAESENDYYNYYSDMMFLMKKKADCAGYIYNGEKAIDYLLKIKGFKDDDVAECKIKDAEFSDLLGVYGAYIYDSCYDKKQFGMKCVSLAASLGDQFSIDFCTAFNIEYKK